MAFYHPNLRMLFGGGPSLTIPNQNFTISAMNQNLAETVGAGTTVRRVTNGPNANGHYSLQVFVDTAGGATSALTVWYSNQAAPSVADDTAWSQDTTIGSIDLSTTVGSPKLFNVGNVDAQWIMLRAQAVTSAANIRAVIRIEGTTHGPCVDGQN
jgi:hypothetical protein